MAIRILNASEWHLKRDLRLAALRDSPKAFASSFDQEVHRSEEEWRDWPRNGAFFAAFDDRQCAVGIAAGWTQPDEPEVIHLVSMWVQRNARRAGISRQLTAAIVEWARQRKATRVELEVAAGNDAAMRSYLRSGFIATNREPSGPCGSVLEFRLT